MTSGRRLFLFLYAASGAAALVYEVTWTRLLTLQLGHTVAAASTVLAAFMGGLALGAWIAGRWNGPKAVPYERSAGTSNRSVGDGLQAVPYFLRAYAILELVVAATALALPYALSASVPALAWAYADGAAPVRFAIVRVVISLALVGIPAAAMGATFPIAVRWFARDAADTGLLYAANTAGAAAGAIAAGFFLIPAVGLRGTTWIGVALNLIAAGGAWWLSGTALADETFSPEQRRSLPRRRSPRAPASEGGRSLRAPRLNVDTGAPSPLLGCTAAALSGFGALVYEVSWTRLLALVIGPTTYAFATMAAAFIAGLAIGSSLGARVTRRTARPAAWLAAMLTVSSVGAAGAAYVAATEMPLVVARQVTEANLVFTRLVLRQAAGTALLLLPMTLALGATFPLALAVASGSNSTTGADAARVYAANTVGAIAGALAAGFVLIPWLGLQATFRATAIVGVLGGATCLFVANRARSPKRLALLTTLPALVAVVTVTAIVLLPPWDRELLASGAYKYSPYLPADSLESVLRAGDLAYYREGAAATVSVRRLTGTTSLAIDGKVDASNSGDMLTQRLLGLLPVLLHGRAQEIAVIGLGSGVTVGSALATGTVTRADVIEISPEVVEASHFFDRESGAPLVKPGVRLIVGDGRSHLLLTPRRYDVIVSEPSNPWMAGVAALFTREFFEAARARLKPDGLLCQWAHTYDISRADLQSIVRTFASVFPQGTLWMVGGGDLLLIGAREGALTPRMAGVEAARQGAAAAALADVGIAEGTAPFALLSLYAGGPRELGRYGNDALMQTDGRTALEYSAPRGIYGRSRDDNATAILALQPEQPPAVRDALGRATDSDWTARGLMEMRAQAFGAAYDAFVRAATMNPRNAAALSGLSDAAGGANRLGDVREWLTRMAAHDSQNAVVRIELSRVLAVTGDAQGAVQAAADALRLAPDDPRAAEQLASVFADTGDAQRLGPLADAMVQRYPARPDAQYYRATALYLRGQNRDAIAAARGVVEIAPGHARAQSLLGAACAADGQRDCARTAFEAAVNGSPHEPAGYVNAGVFNLQAGNASTAAQYFASALTIDPTSKPAREGLVQARSLLANPR
jgi:spermidine synthase